MLRRGAYSAAATLALGAAVLVAPVLADDADRERLVTTQPQIADRGKTAGHVCFSQGGYESEAGGFTTIEDRACTRQFDPLRAALGDTLTVRTPRSARSVSLGVSGAEREDQECRLLEHGRWLCTMPGDGTPSLILGISYPFGGVGVWEFDSALRALNRTARLRIVERAVPSRLTYIEGAVQLVRLRRVGEKGPFLVRALKGKGFTAKLPAGEFVLSSTTRVCSGSCPTRGGGGSLDRPRYTCKSRIAVKRGDRLTARVLTRAGQRCRIR